jgi:hypothetical protein
MTSSTTSLTAPEEARPAAILGTASEEARLVAILGTTKCRCLHVFTLNLYVHMDLWSCLRILCCVCMWWILWSLNECIEYCDLWMNVLYLDVYIDVLYIMYTMYIFYNSSCAGYTVCMYFLQHRLSYHDHPYLCQPDSNVIDKRC